MYSCIRVLKNAFVTSFCGCLVFPWCDINNNKYRSGIRMRFPGWRKKGRARWKNDG